MLPDFALATVVVPAPTQAVVKMVRWRMVVVVVPSLHSPSCCRFQETYDLFLLF